MIKTNSMPVINADLFIIPNHASIAKEYILKRYESESKQIADLNNIPFDVDQTNLVQVWSTDKKCDNMQCGTFHIVCDEYDYSCSLISVLPRTLFEGYKENDIVTCVIPVYVSSYRKSNEDYKSSVVFDDKEQMLVQFNFSLKQLEYRYRSFGTFEDVLEMVCR